MLEQRGYTGLAGHRLEHQNLTRQVHDLRDQFLAGKVTMTTSVMLFLKDWLANHILSRDLQYARELG
jgi:hemerythrin